jgi:protein-L-isoaspartate O-methyltransferase
LSQSKIFEKIAGVEILPELCNICNENMRKIGLQKVTVLQADARIFSDIDSYEVFFMFNPFPEKAMLEVIHRIDESLKKNHRKIAIIYVNNVHEDLIIQEIGSIKKKSELLNLPRYGCSSAIYTNF